MTTTAIGYDYKTIEISKTHALLCKDSYQTLEAGGSDKKTALGATSFTVGTLGDATRKLLKNLYE